MAAPDGSTGSTGPGGSAALIRDVDVYVQQLATASSRAGGAAELAVRATALAEAQRVSAWGLRAAVSAAREQGLSWRELAELLDVPAATLHRQYRSGQALTTPDEVSRRPAPAAPVATVPDRGRADPPAVPIGLDLFIGRDRALADAPRLLTTARMLTLAGPGGVGKTRLASELANRVRSFYRGGILWTELAPITAASADPGHGIEAAIVAAAGPNPHGKSLDDVLRAACAGGQVLLVLDNCEHLVDAAATAASAILSAHPHVRILATSREALRIAGETVMAVPPLPTEPAGTRGGPSPAVRLFVDRARAAAADFDAGEHLVVIAELCRKLDGLPLAIELAARQIAVLPPETLLSRLGERLDLLTGGPRNAPHRQQSVRAAVEWSYQLLDATEQATFRRLALLPGGFDQRTAAAVTADLGLSRAALWGLLAALAGKSLITPDPRVPGRYRMLESLRAYGLEQLDAEHERASTYDQLLGWYADLVAQMYTTFAGRNDLLSSWDAERDNIHDAARAAEADGDPRYPGIANLLAAIWNWRGELPRARTILAGALASRAMSAVDRMETLRRLSVTCVMAGDGAAAINYAEQGLDLARACADTARIAEALSAVTSAQQGMGDYVTGIALMREHLPLVRSLDRSDHLLRILGSLSRSQLAAGDFAAAQDAIDEALAANPANDMTLSTAAMIKVVSGDPDAATAHVTQVLTTAHPGRREVVDCCEVMAVVAAERGEPERALRILGATAAIRAACDFHNDPWWDTRLKAVAATARAAITSASARAATEEGAGLTAEAMAAYALHDTLPGAAADASSPLTEREQRVAELVARGYTNRQIAARLFISNRTVAAHLAHVRAKLGLPSRVHIAAWIIDNKLVDPAEGSSAAPG